MSPRVERVDQEEIYPEGPYDNDESDEDEVDIDMPELLDFGRINMDESDDEDTTADEDEYGRDGRRENNDTERMLEEATRHNNTGNNNDEEDEIIFLHNDNNRYNNNNNENSTNNNNENNDNHDNNDRHENNRRFNNYENNNNNNNGHNSDNNNNTSNNQHHEENNSDEDDIHGNTNNHGNRQSFQGVQQGNSDNPTTGYQRIMNQTKSSDKITTITEYSVQEQLNLLMPKLSYITSGSNDAKPTKRRTQRSLRNFHKQPITQRTQRTKKHQQRQDALSDKICSQNTSEKMLQHWGHPLRIQNNWPITNINNTFRIASVNINGINSNNNYLELETIIGQMAENQIDILCLTEINLDFRKQQVYSDIWTTIKKIDRHIDINMKTSKRKSRIENSTFKPGGTMILTSSAWSGRRIRDFQEPKTCDKFGRWTTTHLRGQSGKKVSIINWYRVIDDRHNVKAINTIYLQQLNDLESAYNKVIDPRKSITKDMEKYIRDLATQGHTVILTGDTNEHLQIPNNDIKKMLDDLDMDNIMVQYHPEATLPTTYDRGENCLDIFAGTKDVTAIVQAAGYLPFYEPFCTDHRVGYIDLDKRKIFGTLKNDTTKAFFHGFNTKHVKKCDKYLQTLEDQFETHQIFNKVTELKSQVNTYLADTTTTTTETTAKLINNICKLEKIRSELMLAAEAKCRTRKYTTQFQFSGKLVTAAKHVWTIKKLLRRISLGNIKCTEIERANTNHMHKQALLNLRLAQRSSYQFREEMMEDLAAKLSQQWKVEHSSAVKMIQNAEASTLLFATVTKIMKPGRKGNIQYVLKPNNTEAQEGEEKNWDIVDDQAKLNKTIIVQNSTHLLKSNKAITAKGVLQKAIGWQAENEDAVQEITSGKYEQHMDPNPSKELNEFMKGLKSPIDHNDPEKKMTWNFGLLEYKKLFGKQEKVQHVVHQDST
jgi:hypothetical protein